MLVAVISRPLGREISVLKERFLASLEMTYWVDKC